MRVVPRFSAVILIASALFCCGIPVISAAVDPSGQGAPPGQGDLTITGQGEGTKALLLGAEIGNRTQKALKITLYVLQAAAPGPPRPDLPNHLFSVVLEDLKERQIVKDASVSGAVSSGGKKQSLSFRFAAPVSYQAGARLANLGLYRIEVAFKRGTEQGKASFRYQAMPAPPAHDDDPTKKPAPPKVIGE
jgi:hypothetical protein